MGPGRSEYFVHHIDLELQVQLICDIFNLEALTVNQVKSFKALADGKNVFIGTKTGSGIFAYSAAIFNSPTYVSQNDSDWLAMTTI
jgi:hypothetical protein